MELAVAPHVALGELTILSFLWVIMEVITGPSSAGVVRMKGAMVVGIIAVFAEWVLAGTYYTVTYGSEVKPVINEGPWPWAHGILMEAKEHIYLFLPFMAVVLLTLVWQYGDSLKDNRGARFMVYAIAGMSIILVLSSGLMGYLISSGYRVAITP